uniref:Uncharacterized protein n=1 Tax=Oryza glumipatula TaxID=40148 RepID=A0A0D9YJZ1_9ORYZ
MVVVRSSHSRDPPTLCYPPRPRKKKNYLHLPRPARLRNTPPPSSPSHPPRRPAAGRPSAILAGRHSRSTSRRPAAVLTVHIATPRRCPRLPHPSRRPAARRPSAVLAGRHSRPTSRRPAAILAFPIRRPPSSPSSPAASCRHSGPPPSAASLAPSATGPASPSRANDRAGDSGFSRRCQILHAFLCFVLLYNIFCLIIWGVKRVKETLLCIFS